MIVVNRKPTQIKDSKMRKILIVEDERIIALNIRESLESLGYAVPAIVTSGEESIKKSIQLHPDLVLMDIRLKGDMDGIEAAEKIWKNLSIPIVFVTGLSDKKNIGTRQTHCSIWLYY